MARCATSRAKGSDCSPIKISPRRPPSSSLNLYPSMFSRAVLTQETLPLPSRITIPLDDLLATMDRISNSCSDFFLAVISMITSTSLSIFPSLSRITVLRTDNHTGLPSFLYAKRSIEKGCLFFVNALAFRITLRSVSLPFKISPSLRPFRSERLYPVITSVASLAQIT